MAHDYNPLSVLETWFEEPYRKVRTIKSKTSGGLKKPRQQPDYPKPARQSLKTFKQIANKTPQVMVKITGSGRGMGQTGNHISYIARNSQIELTDQDGQRLTDKDALRDLKDMWYMAGVPWESAKRETFNIIFGMPVGTPPEALKNAVIEFAAQEFAGHKYVMALHEPREDAKTKNPHVHFCVVATNKEGQRLNPRKNDLQRWREGFAEALRENGIAALATSRRQHFQARHPEKFKAWAMKRRLEAELTKEGGSDGRERGNGRTGRGRADGRDRYARYRNTRGTGGGRAGLHQSNSAQDSGFFATQKPYRLRDLPKLAMVQHIEGREMLLRQDAPDYLGQAGSADTGVRRAGIRLAGMDEAARLKQHAAWREKNVMAGKRLLLDTARQLDASDPKTAGELRALARSVDAPDQNDRTQEKVRDRSR